jgi:hypothetical protein
VTSPPRPGRPALLGWTKHPGFGVLVLFLLAVALIWHGEPQPSSRPSGTSVGVSGTASAGGPIPGLLVLRDGRLELLQQQRITRTVTLPHGAVPRSLITSRGLSVVLAITDGRQRAYAVTSKLAVHDLGYADAVLPAVRGKSAVLVEATLVEPGSIDPALLASASPSSASTGSSGGTTGSPGITGSTTETSGEPLPGPPPLPDYEIRRYDSAGQPTEPPDRLPRGYRTAVDTSVGLVVWQPVNRVFDSGVVHESLSASALLVRPDATIRALGRVHPLAADASQLLVWDVALHRFGVMPLRYVDSTATSTATPSASESAGASDPASSSTATPTATSTKPTPAPTLVAGARWFLPTRGMLLITGPAAFADDGSAFAVYAQVGSRRRLVVAQLKNLGTDQVEVLVLNQPPAKSSPVPSGSSLVLPSPSGSGSSSGAESSSAAGSSRGDPSGSGGSASGSRSATASPTVPALESDGYPIPAPAVPIWLPDNQVVGVAQDGTVIGYRPGRVQSGALDLGVVGLRALAPAP